jgi:hypothetical protein
VKWSHPTKAARFAGYAKLFAAIQERKSKRYGTGRALHRKQLLAAQAELVVLPDLPEFARHGLFAKPATFEARVRLSNGGMDKAPDKQPDIRGFSFAALGVRGDSALGNGPAKSQGFALINQETFAFPKSDEFVDFVAAAAEGKGALLKFLVRRYGLIGGPSRLLKMVASVGKPFAGFANETFFSAAPLACGPYAVRVRLSPDAANGAADPGADADWGADMARRLNAQDLTYTLELQPFVSEAVTPIEDASVNWPTPYTPVARLTLPRQDLSSAAGTMLAAEAEAATMFDPWCALEAHRPLGDVMRARKVVYFQSQQGRGAA